MRVEFVALPQEISVARTECSEGDCERESSAVPKTLPRLLKQCQNQLPTHTPTATRKNKQCEGRLMGCCSSVSYSKA